MNVTRIKPEDIVLCDVRGQRFFAKVTEPVHVELSRRVLSIEPLRPGTHLPAYTVTPRQITDHWRKARSRKGDSV